MRKRDFFERTISMILTMALLFGFAPGTATAKEDEAGSFSAAQSMYEGERSCKSGIYPTVEQLHDKSSSGDNTNNKPDGVINGAIFNWYGNKEKQNSLANDGEIPIASLEPLDEDALLIMPYEEIEITPMTINDNIVFGQQYLGSITATNTFDRYIVTLTAPGRLTVNVTRDSLTDMYVGWYTADGAQIRSTNYWTGTYNQYMDLEAGTYYIEITPYSTSYTGTYLLMVTFTDADHNNIEPNNTTDVAQSLMSGEMVKGFISYQDNTDYYSIVLPEAGRLTISVTRDSLTDMYVGWYTADGAQIRSTNYWTGTYNQYMDLEAGTYYIEITPYSTSYTGTYFLTATLAEADHNNIEPNNTTDDAQSLMPEERVRGFISYQDNADYYSILLPEAGRLTVIVTRDSLTDMYVRWYTADGAQIRSTNYWTGTYSQNMDLEAGTYYIEITPYSTSYTGSYFITADIAPAYNNEIEPNNVIPGEAQLIRSGELIKGFISHQDDIDLYKVELTQKGALSLTITNDSFTTYSSVITVRLYNGITGAEEIPSYSISFSSSNSSRTNTTPGDLEAGIYYILIQKITSYTGAYFLRAEFPPDSLSQTWSTITYNSNGGSGAPPSHAKTPGKAVALSSVYPTRDNYWFLGWSTSNNAVTAQYQPSDFYTTESNLNLFAIWEQILGAPYTITYNANLGLGAPNPQTKTNGADLTLSTTMPTRTNFNFLGWATNSSTDVEEYMPGELYTKDEVTTLYAVWYPVAPSYTITYNANGGVGAPASQVKTHGTSIRLSNLRPTWGNNHVFLGWASSGTATTAQFAPGVTYSIDADRTLYAVWSTTGNTTFVPVMSITGVPSSATAGTPTALTGTVNPSNATNRTISWSTLNAGTTGATITGNTLNSTSAGAVTVRATIVNGLTGATNYTQDFNITVNTIFIPVANITGVPSTATVGTPLALTGTVNPSNATNRTITWSVQNAGTTGTTITGNTFNATSAGAVTIRATIVNGLAGATNYTQDFTITVNAAFIPVTSITGAPSTVTVGTPLTLTGTVNPSTATNRTISWSVQNAGTTGATITGNTFNATSAGVVSVRATIINGVTATTNYTQDFSITVNTVSPTPTQSQSSGGSGSGGGGGIAPPVTPTPTPTPTPTHTPTPTPTPTALPKTDSNKESGDDENITKTLSRRQRTTINNWVPSGPVSEWAVPEIQRAFELDLIPESLVSEGLDFTAPITRVEFAGIAVKAYENLAESRVQINGSNPFIDTNDPDALKAFSAGIMIGYSDERFEPYILLNREQCATALTRVFKRAMIDDWTYETDSNYPLNFTWPAPFDDDAVISIWAKESVYFMAANGIIHGIGNNRFAPRATTSTEEATGYALATREEAIAIAVRMVDTFR